LIYYLLLIIFKSFIYRWFKSPDLNLVSGRLLTTVISLFLLCFGRQETTK